MDRTSNHISHRAPTSPGSFRHMPSVIRFGMPEEIVLQSGPFNSPPHKKDFKGKPICNPQKKTWTAEPSKLYRVQKIIWTSSRFWVRQRPATDAAQQVKTNCFEDLKSLISFWQISVTMLKSNVPKKQGCKFKWHLKLLRSHKHCTKTYYTSVASKFRTRITKKIHPVS